MQAALIVTLDKKTPAEAIFKHLTTIARQRNLVLMDHTVEAGKITARVDGKKLDIHVLTNAIASGFPKVRVQLSPEPLPLLPLDMAHKASRSVTG